MEFFITIKHQFKEYRLKVVQLPGNDRLEYFVLIASNKTIIFESNRPLYRNKGLKHRRPDFKLIYGKLAYQSALEDITAAIYDELDKEKGKRL